MTNTKSLGPKDVILQVVSILALYISVGAFFALSFAIIETLFPTVGEGYSLFAYPNSQVRFPVALLIVAFPLYVWLSIMVERGIADPALRGAFRTRKWLIYITIAAASATIAFTAVQVLFSYLNGDITIRFALRALVVIFVAAAVVTYYRQMITRALAEIQQTSLKFLAYGVIAVVTATIVIGLGMSGSPTKVRGYQNDMTRANDLYNIQMNTNNYWAKNVKLPDSLQTLQDPNLGFVVPVDPSTRAAYEYRKIDAKTYELCATFQYPSRPDNYYQYYSQPEVFYQHDTGGTCFTRNVDESLRDPNVKPVPIGL